MPGRTTPKGTPQPGQPRKLKEPPGFAAKKAELAARMYAALLQAPDQTMDLDINGQVFRWWIDNEGLMQSRPLP